MKKALLILFIAACLVQLAVPGYFLQTYEHAQSKGDVYKFRIGLHDPYDPFRGHYVDMDFELDELICTAEEARNADPYEKTEVYIVLDKVSEDRMVESIRWTPERPESGVWFKALLEYAYEYREEPFIRFQFPFDTYYMNEKRARPAERAYLKLTEEERENSWLEVAILDGLAVPKQLYLAGVPVDVYLERRAKKKLETKSAK